MNARLTILLVGAALLVGGCGDKTETVTKTTPAAKAPVKGPDQNCDKAGINARVRNEGTCTQDGVKVTIANRSSKLRLDELTAELVDVQQTKTLSTSNANGEYAVLTVAITNRTSEPKQWEGVADDQAALLIKDKRYSRSTDAEIGLDDGFLSQTDDIQPGERKVGKLVFDLPPPASEAARSGKGSLLITDFSNGFDETNLKRFGGIRLSR